jgi:hypothetical protein
MATLDKYYQFTNTGIVIPDTATIKAEVETEYKAIWGSDIDISPASVFGRFIAREVEERTSIVINNARSAGLLNFKSTGGVFLRAIGALFGIEYSGATPTTVLCTIIGTPNLNISNGFIVEDINGKRFTLDSPITLNADGIYENANFTCMETGAIFVAANTVNRLISSVLGVSSVNNAADGITGKKAITDAEYSKKIENNRYSGSALLQSIKTKINNVDGVLSSQVVENFTAEVQIIQGVEVKPHSVLAVVDGGNADDVARALFLVKTTGAAFNGDVAVNITDDYGRDYEILFYRPQLNEVQVQVSVKNDNNLGTEQIKSVIMEYVNGLDIAAQLSPFEISAYLNTKGNIFISDCQIALAGGTLGYAVLTQNLLQKWNIAVDNINVVLADN